MTDEPTRRHPGRPMLPPGEKRVRKMVQLSPSEIAQAKELGGGNMARGIRLALEVASVVQLRDRNKGKEA